VGRQAAPIRARIAGLVVRIPFGADPDVFVIYGRLDGDER